MDPRWLGRTRRPRIWEREVSVAHEGHVVVLVMRQERCRVVVLLIMVRRTFRKERWEQF